MIQFRPKNAGNFELSAIGITAFAKFILQDKLEMRALFIGTTCLFWIWYVVFRFRHDKNILKAWGFRKENFWKSWVLFLPLLLTVLSIFLIPTRSSINLRGIFPVLLLYPVWGLIQQFIFLCIIGLNIQHVRPFSNRKLLLIVFISTVFSLIHYPYLWLMLYTFLMELVFSAVFLKWRNLWAVGLAHGWTATFLLYYWLDRNIWNELFAWF